MDRRRLATRRKVASPGLDLDELTEILKWGERVLQHMRAGRAVLKSYDVAKAVFAVRESVAQSGDDAGDPSPGPPTPA